VRTTGVGAPERGYDGAKRLAGRKRHLLVDTGGLVLGVHVHAASLHDRDGARELLTDELQRGLPRSAIVWADAAYTGAGSGSGLVRSEDGAWRCLTTLIGSSVEVRT
jgi:putative transposase